MHWSALSVRGWLRAITADLLPAVGIAAEDESETEAEATAPEVWQNRGEALLKLIYGTHGIALAMLMHPQASNTMYCASASVRTTQTSKPL